MSYFPGDPFELKLQTPGRLYTAGVNNKQHEFNLGAVLTTMTWCVCDVVAFVSYRLPLYNSFFMNTVWNL